MVDFKNVRVYKFGIFYLMNKYRVMLEETGKVKFFRGSYAKYKKRISSIEDPEHSERLEESNLEGSEGREDSK
jgi:hypothetical protein